MPLLHEGRFFPGGVTVGTVDPHADNVVFLSSFEGSDTDTSAFDDSKSNHNMLFGDLAQLDSSQSKFGNTSAVLNGFSSGDFIRIANNGDFWLSGNFTLEGFVRFNDDLTVNQTLMSLWNNNAPANQISWWFGFRGAEATKDLAFLATTDGTTGTLQVVVNVAWTPNLGQWYHIAAERFGNIWRLYIDGIEVAETENSITLFQTTSNIANAHIGAVKDAAGDGIHWEMDGWIDEVRLTKGVARYQGSNFTVPTEPYPRPVEHTIDANFSSVVFLASFDGATGGLDVSDMSSANTPIDFLGGAIINNGVSKFGNGSLLLTRASSSFIEVPFGSPELANFNFDAGAFTIEGFFRFRDNTLTVDMINKWRPAGGSRGWRLRYDAAADALQFQVTPDGSTVTTLQATSWVPTNDQWYHIAVDRSGDTWRLYVDGSMVASITNSLSIFTAGGAVLRIGLDGSGSTSYFDGDVDEVRINKGLARYASDGGFTVPTEQYPRRASTAPVVTFRGVVGSGAEVDIGTASADRLVVVCPVHSRTSAPGRAINSVTIAGEAATIHDQIGNNANSGAGAGIASRVVDAGTTAVVSWALSGTVLAGNNRAAVYTITGLGTPGTPHDSVTGNDDDPTVLLNLLGNGVSIVIAHKNSTSDWTLTGVDNLDAEANLSNGRYAAAHSVPTTFETNHSIQASSDHTNEVLVAVSWD